ncbi:MAG: 4-diphosphocytidyl-2-C-methyl-D-erythritol kinase [Planctomycetota bacterium]
MSEVRAGASEFVTILAPAKVNLFLEIVARRADGFHELVSSMLALDLSDRLSIASKDSPGIRLRLEGPHASPDIPTGGRNLVVRVATAALRQAEAEGHPVPEGLELILDKRIPSQAGLGGGSADAAAAWIAVEQSLGVGLDPKIRHQALAAVGSDCVFFAEAVTGSGLCTGRGEQVQTLPAPSADWFLALVTPEVRCPTGTVYSALPQAIDWKSPAMEAPSRMLEMEAEPARALLFNRLERAATRAVPEMSAWFDCLKDANASHFRLCGSGSSVFGLYPDAASAQASLVRIQDLALERTLNIRGSWVLKPAGRAVVRT